MSYRSEFYAFGRSDVPLKSVVRTYGASDFEQLIDMQRECFPPPFPPELWWNREQLASHVERFPEGALCVEADGMLVGSMTGLLVRWDPQDRPHTWAEITDEGYIRNHDPSGDTLYIVDISVRPSHRKYGYGKALMHAMYHLVVEKRLKRLLGGGRMSGYHEVADAMTAEQYADEVVSGLRKDPVITFLLRCGRTPVAVAENYLEDDESRNYALLMEWRNPFCRS
ncbi:GNAT family N-acetyltransferase [Paenibacillus alkalitolerans]|uniref:GNAT family N-acetyltransferase n=1 Tax=Paenibacillus alkalitolerans TaxID=2799335 RepID=UPI0018F474FD|nr:GNAT family N-acetyltransferase [Paenibacillus alkalitolerans]